MRSEAGLPVAHVPSVPHVEQKQAHCLIPNAGAVETLVLFFVPRCLMTSGASLRVSAAEDLGTLVWSEGGELP